MPAGGGTEVQVGEIPRAFQMTIVFGPVRIAFTSARILVFQTGEHRNFPSLSLYRQWKDALPGGERWTSTNVPVPLSGGESPLWEFDNASVQSVHAHPPHGIAVDRDSADLDLYVDRGGVRAKPSAAGGLAGVDGAGGARIVWRVPGDARDLVGFLRTMPIGARVTDRVAGPLG